jgi:hypothetical protein
LSSWPLEGTTPLIADRFINTFIAGEDLLTIGYLVEITADNTVKKSTMVSNSTKVVGVTTTVAKSGQKVSVVARGICRVIPFTSLSAGDQFGGSAGTAIQDNNSKNSTILGICLQGGNSAGTAIVALW